MWKKSDIWRWNERPLSNGTDIYGGNLEKTIGWARIDQPETFFLRSFLKEIGPVNVMPNFTMDKEMYMRYLFYGLHE